MDKCEAGFRLLVLTGGNNSGKTLATKIIREKTDTVGLSAYFREGMTVYQNFSLLIYGTINDEFINHLNTINQDVLLEKTRIFHSDYVSFGFYLKTIVSQIYGIEFNVLLSETEKDKKIREERNLRQHLINFAETAKEFDREIWAKALFSLINIRIKKQLNNCTNDKTTIIINDLRSVPELEYLLGYPGIETFRVVKINRDGMDLVDPELMNRIKIEKDIIYSEIDNNGTLEQFRKQLLDLLK